MQRWDGWVPQLIQTFRSSFTVHRISFPCKAHSSCFAENNAPRANHRPAYGQFCSCTGSLLLIPFLCTAKRREAERVQMGEIAQRGPDSWSSRDGVRWCAFAFPDASRNLSTVVTFPNVAARTIPKMFYRFYDPFPSSMLRDRKMKTLACCNAQLCWRYSIISFDKSIWVTVVPYLCVIKTDVQLASGPLI